ncbi:hypothetical protein FRC08_008692 [Ceratobasidium sp. 394]|nr:hypothetical protein FRC08_008692 [Ceratobasidium sp. 394]
MFKDLLAQAPELVKGRSYSAPADVYALGMTMLEAITGDVSYAELKLDFAVLYAVAEKKYPKRPQVHIPDDSEHGDILWVLLQRCWTYEPEERPSAAEVKEMMSWITQEGLRPRRY